MGNTSITHTHTHIPHTHTQRERDSYIYLLSSWRFQQYYGSLSFGSCLYLGDWQTGMNFYGLQSTQLGIGNVISILMDREGSVRIMKMQVRGKYNSCSEGITFVTTYCNPMARFLKGFLHSLLRGKDSVFYQSQQFHAFTFRTLFISFSKIELFIFSCYPPFDDQER